MARQTAAFLLGGRIKMSAYPYRPGEQRFLGGYGQQARASGSGPYDAMGASAARFAARPAPTPQAASPAAAVAQRAQQAAGRQFGSSTAFFDPATGRYGLRPVQRMPVPPAPTPPSSPIQLTGPQMQTPPVAAVAVPPRTSAPVPAVMPPQASVPGPILQRLPPAAQQPVPGGDGIDKAIDLTRRLRAAAPNEDSMGRSLIQFLQPPAATAGDVAPPAPAGYRPDYGPPLPPGFAEQHPQAVRGTAPPMPDERLLQSQQALQQAKDQFRQRVLNGEPPVDLQSLGEQVAATQPQEPGFWRGLLRGGENVGIGIDSLFNMGTSGLGWIPSRIGQAIAPAKSPTEAYFKSIADDMGQQFGNAAGDFGRVYSGNAWRKPPYRFANEEARRIGELARTNPGQAATAGWMGLGGHLAGQLAPAAIPGGQGGAATTLRGLGRAQLGADLLGFAGGSNQPGIFEQMPQPGPQADTSSYSIQGF